MPNARIFAVPIPRAIDFFAARAVLRGWNADAPKQTVRAREHDLVSVGAVVWGVHDPALALAFAWAIRAEFWRALVAFEHRSRPGPAALRRVRATWCSVFRACFLELEGRADVEIDLRPTVDAA